MLIAPQTFVILFIMVAMAGSRFNYWIVVFCLTYIGGIIFATEMSKYWGLM